MCNKSVAALMVIFLGLCFSPITYGQSQALSEDISDENLSESIVIEGITPDKEFEIISNAKDPFKPLVIKKVIKYVEPVRLDKKNKSIKPEIKVIAPLKLKITGICGNSIKRQVVVQYKNKEYTLDAGQEIKNKFKVININTNKVTVFSIPESIRRTFKL